MSKLKVRTCPICGKEMTRIMYHIHMKHPESNLTTKDIALIEAGLTEPPKCPICGKECSLRRFGFNETCGDRHCNEANKVRKGTHGLLAKNCERTPDGKLIRCINSNKSALENGNHSSQRPKVIDGNKCILYIMEFDDCIKVGRTRDLDSRLKHFNDMNFYPLRVRVFEGEERDTSVN